MFDTGALEKVYDYLSSKKDNESFQYIEKNRTNLCIKILQKILREENFIEEKCPFNNFVIGEHFRDLINNKEYESNFPQIYVYCARILGEYILYLRRKGGNNLFLEECWRKFREEEISSLGEEYQSQIKYIQNEMSIDILNFCIGDKSYESFLKYEKLSKDVEDKNSKFNTEQQEKIDYFSQLLSSKEETVNRLASQLKEQETAFNFVMLNKGFANILSKKETSKKVTFFTLFLLSLVLAFVPLMYVIGRLFNVLNLQEVIISMGWEQMLPVAGLEFILIYIFRVVLNHYSSLETQIMQLELRQSLCQFIQSYVDYAKDIKKDDKDALDKFENLIFSSILSNSDKVPSTFDGVEQLTNLFEKIKK